MLYISRKLHIKLYFCSVPSKCCTASASRCIASQILPLPCSLVPAVKLQQSISYNLTISPSTYLLHSSTYIVQSLQIIIKHNSLICSSHGADVVVLLAGQRTCNSQVAGSSSGGAPLRHWESYICLCASVTKQYNSEPAKWGDLFGWESNRGHNGM